MMSTKEHSILSRIFPLLLSILLSCMVPLSASEDASPYSIRLGYGFSDLNDLGDILSGTWHRYEGDTSVINLDSGYRFWKDVLDLPLDFYIKGGVSYFHENGALYQGEVREDFFEITTYAKAYLNLDFWYNRIRLGAGEGISITQEIPIVEYIDAENSDGTRDPTAKFLNYLDLSVDLDVGRLIHVKSMEELYFGYTLKHRSGAFGLFNGVHGGSNYNMFTIEKNY